MRTDAPDPRQPGGVQPAGNAARLRRAVDDYLRARRDAERRQAVVELLHLLAQRQGLLGAALPEADADGGITRIALDVTRRNARRHREQGRRVDGLDLVFWWCHTSIEVIDQLLGGAAPSPSPAGNLPRGTRDVATSGPRA
ncbi:hypothetical protein [Frankia sp. QA3]|uniref:hypothetical protein n=1 Tax=Frankia sp. QA3 TaxID=710111 RepID=UPI000269BEA8|nr:hypothetical protein [Frankia sp. QA3]EIV91464.1 hypothetical protein FraQA3DRAFT_0919 [Frankia sp. QA3]